MFRKVMALVILGACSQVVIADGENKPRAFDWPQWQGPDRNAISRETGLLKKWPKEGPKLVWKADKLGGGYSAPAVSAGRIFGMSFRGQDEVVWALDEATGKGLWATRMAEARRAPGAQGPEGSRGTPSEPSGRCRPGARLASAMRV